MSAKFGVISIWAKDVPGTARFYREVLGLGQFPHQGERAAFDVHGVYLLILKGRSVPAEAMVPERFPLFALSVEDLDSMVKRLEEHRVPLPWGIERDASGRWVMFHDPAGNLIELVQWMS